MMSISVSHIMKGYMRNVHLDSKCGTMFRFTPWGRPMERARDDRDQTCKAATAKQSKGLVK